MLLRQDFPLLLLSELASHACLESWLALASSLRYHEVVEKGIRRRILAGRHGFVRHLVCEKPLPVVQHSAHEMIGSNSKALVIAIVESLMLPVVATLEKQFAAMLQSATVLAQS